MYISHKVSTFATKIRHNLFGANLFAANVDSMLFIFISDNEDIGHKIVNGSELQISCFSCILCRSVWR